MRARKATDRPDVAPAGAQPLTVFGDLFATGQRPEIAPGSLLDLPGAAEWFALLLWGVNSDLYTYQQALAGRAGPHAAVTSGRRLLMLSSYDYLGLIGHPAIEAAAVSAIHTHGTGTGGVRMLTGTAAIHQQLEREIAAFMGTEAALNLSSGYAANLAAIATLFGPDDLVFADSLAHRSLIDACALARVPVRRFGHNDPAALESGLSKAPRARRVLIVVEGVYSMEGDVALLPAFVELKQRIGAFLLVDEAHSLGVLGQTGRGVHEHFGVPPGAVDIWTGSLSKAVPSTGGFVAGSQQLITYLQHHAASFIFSSAAAPAAAGAARAALQVMAREPTRLSSLRRNTVHLRGGLRDLGFDVGTGTAPIVPVKVKQDVAAYRFARELLDLGVMATAIVHPAVPRGEARLRLCATAAHSSADIEDALRAFSRCRATSSLRTPSPAFSAPRRS